MKQTELSGWGRVPSTQTSLIAPRDEEALRTALLASPSIARGNGRAYGDSAASPNQTLHMRHFNRMRAFDPSTGALEAEAGVMLGDIISTFLPRGWFPAVSPGTKFVTLGGMIAADVHGKNHHQDGGMSACLDWIELMLPSGDVVRCSRDENADLFAWTCGGMGLTGVILAARVRLKRVETGYIQQRTLPVANLDTMLSVLEAEANATYSVAWIDCLARGESLGRGLVLLGEHARLADLPDGYAPFATGGRRSFALPFDAPGFLLNSASMRAFNALYWAKCRYSAGPSLVNWDQYFYPLDRLLGWNRIYGRRGFLQFQCVLPTQSAETGMKALLEATSKAGQGSFLAVLKRFGAEAGPYSFPMPGLTLALDFPNTAAARQLMDQLDAITLAHGGRFYLAKDARLSAETLRQSDARTAEFVQMRQQAGAQDRLTSAQSERLSL